MNRRHIPNTAQQRALQELAEAVRACKAAGLTPLTIFSEARNALAETPSQRRAAAGPERHDIRSELHQALARKAR